MNRRENEKGNTKDNAKVNAGYAKYINRAWLCGVLAGLALLGIGAMQNQLTVVWQKAVMICMECIGIG